MPTPTIHWKFVSAVIATVLALASNGCEIAGGGGGSSPRDTHAADTSGTTGGSFCDLSEWGATAVAKPWFNADTAPAESIALTFSGGKLATLDGATCQFVSNDLDNATLCADVYQCGECTWDVEHYPNDGVKWRMGLKGWRDEMPVSCATSYYGDGLAPTYGIEEGGGGPTGCTSDAACGYGQRCDLATGACVAVACVSAGSSCVSAPCCSGPTCVETASAVECLQDCSTPSQCSSNCCYPLASGGSVCVDAEYCANCAGPNQECSPTTNPCCPGSACVWVEYVGARCEVQSAECPAGCTNPYGSSCCRPPFCAGDCVGSPCCQ